jgi:hypothetical protein
MTKAERTERMRALSRLALGILRWCGERGAIDRDGGGYRLSEVRHNEIRITLLRPIADEDRASTLDIRFDARLYFMLNGHPAPLRGRRIGRAIGRRHFAGTINCLH